MSFLTILGIYELMHMHINSDCGFHKLVTYSVKRSDNERSENSAFWKEEVYN